jgi:hypothetical protein
MVIKYAKETGIYISSEVCRVMAVKTVAFRVVTIVVLWVASDVSEEHAAFVFTVEAYKFRNRLVYTGKLHGVWLLEPRRGGENRNPVLANRKKLTALIKL